MTDRRAIRDRRAATGRLLAGILARGAAIRVDDHIQIAGAQVAIIVADGGDPTQAIQDARPALRPLLRRLAEHLAYTSRRALA